MTVKPFFDQGHYTQFHNALLDTVLPRVSSSAWKILSLVIRQTVGWNRVHKGLSYSALKRGTGIKGQATIRRALKELTKGDKRTRLLDSIPGEGQFDETSYGLNRSAEINWTPDPNEINDSNEEPEVQQIASSEIELGEPKPQQTASSISELAPSSEIELGGGFASSKIELINKKEESLFYRKNKEEKKAPRSGSPKREAAPGREVGAEEKTQQKPVRATQWTDGFIEVFKTAFLNRYGLAYDGLAKSKAGRNMKALHSAPASFGEAFTLQLWTTACAHYFASQRPQHTIHELVDRLPIYALGPTDRFGHLADAGAAAPQRNSGRLIGQALYERNRQVGEEWLAENARLRAAAQNGQEENHD